MRSSLKGLVQNENPNRNCARDNYRNRQGQDAQGGKKCKFAAIHPHLLPAPSQTTFPSSVLRSLRPESSPIPPTHLLTFSKSDGGPVYSESHRRSELFSFQDKCTAVTFFCLLSHLLPAPQRILECK